MGGDGVNAFPLLCRPQGHRPAAPEWTPSWSSSDRLGLVRDSSPSRCSWCSTGPRTTWSTTTAGPSFWSRSRSIYCCSRCGCTSMKSSQEDAGASAADRGHQRQVQEPLAARSQESRAEPGSDGSVQEGRRESRGRLPADADCSFRFSTRFTKCCSVTIEMRGASWLWVHDLSQPETLAIHLLP